MSKTVSRRELFALSAAAPAVALMPHGSWYFHDLARGYCNIFGAYNVVPQAVTLTVTGAGGGGAGGGATALGQLVTAALRDPEPAEAEAVEEPEP